MEKILIIANSRFNGGLSGSDAIYDNFIKHWGGKFDVQTMLEIDYKPFFICYLHRLLLSVVRGFRDTKDYRFVYSASDFLPDVIPAFIMRIRGLYWVSGFFLEAFKENTIHYYTQKISKVMIRKADMVVLTNTSMLHLFPNKKKTFINGGIDLSLAKLSNEIKMFDAVFCGRIHPSKGIDELLDIWKIVRKYRDEATLAIIGDGDLGKEYIIKKLKGDFMGITLYGYMGNERFDIYRKSRIVLYPTPYKYNHFSIAPVEAMACGCPMIAFNLPVMQEFEKNYGLKGCALIDDNNVETFAYAIISYLNGRYKEKVLEAYDWGQTWDYKKQALGVYKDICKELNL